MISLKMMTLAFQTRWKNTCFSQMSSSEYTPNNNNYNNLYYPCRELCSIQLSVFQILCLDELEAKEDFDKPDHWSGIVCSTSGICQKSNRFVSTTWRRPKMLWQARQPKEMSSRLNRWADNGHSQSLAASYGVQNRLWFKLMIVCATSELNTGSYVAQACYI